MRWNHGHSWAAGILTGILVSQHSVILLLVGSGLTILFYKLGALYRLVIARLNRRMGYSAVTGKNKW